MNIFKIIVTWLCQLGAGTILLLAGFGKLQASPQDVETFTLLNMEPNGRVLIGICELIAGAGLLHRLSAAYAALLGSFVLTGAGLAHVGPLGYEGINIFAPTYAALLVVVVLRWRELPFSASKRRH